MRMWICDLVDRLMSGGKRTVVLVVREMLIIVFPSQSHVLMLGVGVGYASLVGILGWCVPRSGSWRFAFVSSLEICSQVSSVIVHCWLWSLETLPVSTSL
jgi:hypothetical protein